MRPALVAGLTVLTTPACAQSIEGHVREAVAASVQRSDAGASHLPNHASRSDKHVAELTTGQVSDSGPPRPVRPTTSCTMTRIVDGDTIVCSRVGRIRLIGMDTPELGQAPFGAQAAEALAALIPAGTTVELERDVEPRDRYDRVLAYIWHDGAMVNWLLVRHGFAVTLTYPPNVQYVEWFRDAQRRAQAEGRGLWAAGGFDCAPVDRRRGRCD